MRYSPQQQICHMGDSTVTGQIASRENVKVKCHTHRYFVEYIKSWGAHVSKMTFGKNLGHGKGQNMGHGQLV